MENGHNVIGAGATTSASALLAYHMDNPEVPSGL